MSAISGVEPEVTFADFFDGMLLVARVDALGRIPGEEIRIELQPGDALHDRETLFFRDTGVDGRFVDDDVAPEMTLPTVSLAPSRGRRSGRLLASTGVGTATT